MQQNSSESEESAYVRHVVYLNRGGMDRLEDIAETIGVVTEMHGRVTVSGLLRLVCSNHLRIVRGRKFYAISQRDSSLLGVSRAELLQRKNERGKNARE